MDIIPPQHYHFKKRGIIVDSYHSILDYLSQFDNKFGTSDGIL